MAWQYWQATQTPGLTPAAEAQPSAAAGQDEVVMMQESASAAVPGETMVETEAPADTVATAARPSDIGSVTPVAAASPTATAAKRASQRTPTSSTASTSTPAPSVARAAPAPARQLETGDRPAQLVRSQTQSQLQIAWSALRQGEAARAQTLYQQVLASRPDDPDATLGLAVSLHRQRQLEAAWLAYQRSLQMWPDNETARTGMLAILSESDPDTAESRLQEWVQSRPRDAAAQAALGNLLGRQGRWAQALGPLTLAQSLAPDSAPHAYNLAVALDQARRYDDALQMYRYTLQLGAAGVSAQALERRIAELQGVAAR
jgi:tetratricopeptide (TPR) repeat protein